MNHTSAVAVNSDREFLSQLKGWLAERGVSAVCTSSATSALDIVEQNEDVHLVITDTDLDDHSGLVLIEKMNSVLAPRRIFNYFRQRAGLARARRFSHAPRRVGLSC